VLPVLLMVVLGLLQGLVLGVEALRVSSAAREGARAAAVGRDAEGVRQAAIRGGGGLDADRLDLVLPPLPATSGQPVSVSVGYRARFFVPGLATMAPEPVLRSTATMLAE